MKTSFDGKTLGGLGKEADLESGPLVEIWKELAGKGLSDMKQVNIQSGIGRMFAVKERDDISKVTTGASITSQVLKKFLIPELEEAIDSEAKVKHSKIAENIEDIIFNPEKINKMLTADDVDSCYTPIIQSGPYDLLPTAVSEETNLKFGTIIVALGVRYKSFCSNVCRTIFVNPTDEQKKFYESMLTMHSLLVSLLKPGAVLGEVYEQVEKKCKSLGHEKYFYKRLGYGMGLEFRESYLIINAKSQRVVEPGMVFNIEVGLENIPHATKQVNDGQGKTYSMKIADTVLISESDCTFLTKNARKFDDVAYSLEDSDVEEVKVKKEKKESGSREKKRSEPQVKKEHSKKSDKIIDLAGTGVRVTRQTLKRLEKTEVQKSGEAARHEHQLQLWNKMKADALEKLSSEGAEKKGEEENEVEETPIAYETVNNFPPHVPKNRIFVDQKTDTVLLPIYGDLVPFHISIIRNCSRLEADEFELRINFVAPSGGIGGSTANCPAYAQNPHSVFVREVTYRLGNEAQLTKTMKSIQDLKKRWTQRESMKKKTEGIVKQDTLVLNPNRHNQARLSNLLIRPTLGGKKATGTLEQHKNGFRYIGGRGQTLDIMFNNIRHAIYQPARNSLSVLIHFHLKNAIMIGKKRTMDVQFYVEVVEAIREIEKERRSAWDQDEMEEEQREREHKKKWNEAFRVFVAKCEDYNENMKFDSPYFELGFYGVAERNNVKLLPTMNCLIHILDTPFFVLDLDDVEIAVFERVQYGLKNFDLLFVNKDWTKMPKRVDSIPMDSLDAIEEWLDSCDIKYYKSKSNLNWKHILKVAVEDPLAFWEEAGGWGGFLGSDGEAEGEEEEEEESEEFEPEGDEDSFSEDDDESDFSEVEESDDVLDSDAISDEDEDSDAMDWDEMEKKAEEEDRRKRFDSREGAGSSRSRKRKNDEYSDSSDDDRYKPAHKKTKRR